MNLDWLGSVARDRLQGRVAAHWRSGRGWRCGRQRLTRPSRIRVEVRVGVRAPTGAQTDLDCVLKVCVRLLVELLLDLQLNLFLGLADSWNRTSWDYFHIRSGLFCLAVHRVLDLTLGGLSWLNAFLFRGLLRGTGRVRTRLRLLLITVCGLVAEGGLVHNRRRR